MRGDSGRGRADGASAADLLGGGAGVNLLGRSLGADARDVAVARRALGLKEAAVVIAAHVADVLDIAASRLSADQRRTNAGALLGHGREAALGAIVNCDAFLSGEARGVLLDKEAVSALTADLIDRAGFDQANQTSFVDGAAYACLLSDAAHDRDDIKIGGHDALQTNVGLRVLTTHGLGIGRELDAVEGSDRIRNYH